MCAVTSWISGNKCALLIDILLGKAAFLKSIDYMILKRMQRNEDPSVTALAIREFELRKRAVKNM